MERPDPTNQEQFPPPTGPLPNRFTRTTALGCLGILGVLALPAVFFLPLENWHGPNWAIQAIWLAAFAALAGGAWLLVRVPATDISLSRDARVPTTHNGREPILEAPARRSNRIVLCVLMLVVLAAAVSYVATSASTHTRDFATGVVSASVAGLVAIGIGAGVALRRVPPPAWEWTRIPVRTGPALQGLAIGLFGLAVLGWSLLEAAGHRYAWGALGLAVLVLSSVLAPPLAARWPTRGRAWTRGDGASVERNRAPPDDPGGPGGHTIASDKPR